jgi:hypothetical protein
VAAVKGRGSNEECAPALCSGGNRHAAILRRDVGADGAASSNH